MGMSVRWRDALRGGGLAILVTAGLFMAPAEAAVPKTVPPVTNRSASVVTADALPTVQIDGIVWTQAIAGNTVYAAGAFTRARPAGKPLGDPSSVDRRNLLAYSLTTGKLNTTFKPLPLDGEVRALALSPDGRTLYVGGTFTKVGTSKRLRFAALDARTGALLKPAPQFSSRVDAITVAGESVYVGGWFRSVNGATRSRLAAISATTGKMTAWAPKASDAVRALVATPDKTKIIVGGAFATINGTQARGMGAVDAKTGGIRPWKINAVVKDDGVKSAILSLAVDKDTVYGSGYAFGGGNFEGAFAASPMDGSIRWLQDCHGDTYSVAPIGQVVYAVGHAHHCANIGGMPDTSPRNKWYRALAMTKAARGTVAVNSQVGKNYGNFAGQPAPSLYNWFPHFSAGSVSGASQGAWSIVGNSTYISAGGEFPAVNGVVQQGLARFALPTVAPRAQGPLWKDATTAPVLVAQAADAVKVSWSTNMDRDDKVLTYTLLRDGTPVMTTMADALFWKRRGLTFLDPGRLPGASYGYQVVTADADGNRVESPTTTITVPGAPTPTPTPTDPAGTPVANG